MLLQDLAGIVGAAVTVVTGVALLTQRGRGLAKKIWQKRKDRSEMPGMIKQIVATQLLVKADVREVKAEVVINGGGSVKDAVLRLEHKLANDFWLKGQPAFVCDDKGRSVELTEAYCELVGVRNLAELTNVSWRRFVHAEDLDEYHRVWKYALTDGVPASIKARFLDQDGAARGRWLVRLLPFEQRRVPGSEEKSWYFTGYFYPMDDRAKEIWEENHWSS